MARTDQTIMEQMKITSREISRRKQYLGLSDKDAQTLESLRSTIFKNVDEICEQFYECLLAYDEMDEIIGDSETLNRLKNYQRNYILTLFEGQYDEEYIQSRLRIGLVHRRIGVDPKYYISAVFHLNQILKNFVVKAAQNNCMLCQESLLAVDKILNFDLTLVVDTYIDSLMDNARRSKEKLEDYTRSLEDVVAKRTQLLKDQARHDGLTGLLNQRAFYQELKRELSRSNRLSYTVTLLYFDLDKFKILNDTQGHRAGDSILIAVAEAIKKVSRGNEIIARYGGDEFCIILSETSLEEGTTAAGRFSESIKTAVKGSPISCSMGVASSTPDLLLDSDTLVRRADKAMYEAKKEKGFTIHYDRTGRSTTEEENQN